MARAAIDTIRLLGVPLDLPYITRIKWALSFVGFQDPLPFVRQKNLQIPKSNQTYHKLT